MPIIADAIGDDPIARCCYPLRYNIHMCLMCKRCIETTGWLFFYILGDAAVKVGGTREHGRRGQTN